MNVAQIRMYIETYRIKVAREFEDVIERVNVSYDMHDGDLSEFTEEEAEQVYVAMLLQGRLKVIDEIQCALRWKRD